VEPKEFYGVEIGTTRGALLGIVNLKDIVHYQSREQFDADINKHHAEGYFDEHEFRNGKAYGFVLEVVERFEKPIPWKGRQRWFDVPQNAIELRVKIS